MNVTEKAYLDQNLPKHWAVPILTNAVVYVPFWNVFCQSKVANLHKALILYKHIPGSQIPVDIAL